VLFPSGEIILNGLDTFWRAGRELLQQATEKLTAFFDQMDWLGEALMEIWTKKSEKSAAS